MRFLLALPLFAVLFSACSKNTAFHYFTKLDSRHERAVSNLQNITLKEDNRTAALLNVIYLNPVDPDLYQNQHFFFVAQFDTRKEPLEHYTITLNGRPPVGIAPLDDNCSLRSLMPLNNPWNAYYEIVFKGSDDENLTLRFETDPSLQGEATYYTDQ